MNGIVRHSPVVFDAKPLNTEPRNHWNVVLEYENQGQGLHVVDLSHCTRWDVQSRELGALQPAGGAIPESPGACALKETLLINRMNRTQAAVWHLSGQPVELPRESAYTETTEMTLLLALCGKGVFQAAEKLTNLDLEDPQREPPFLLQGPLAHVPCQVVVLSRMRENPGILFTCSRGYGRDMTRAILHAGDSVGLRPAGEAAFQTWLKSVTGK